MGFNTSVTIVNDNLGQIRGNPAAFVDDICTRLQSGGTTIDGHTVHQSDHADATQLIAVGGNCSTKVFTIAQSLAHHTEGGQVQLLQHWAAALGYRLVEGSD